MRTSVARVCAPRPFSSPAAPASSAAISPTGSRPRATTCLVFDSLARARRGGESRLAEAASSASHRHRSIADIRDEAAVAEAAARAAAVFHMAAQVAVTTSLADPRQDFEINLRRHAAPAGSAAPARRQAAADLRQHQQGLWRSRGRGAGAMTASAICRAIPELRAHGIGEDRPISFHTPYGCSKGAADQYVLDYARSFGIPTAVLRMSCIYGRRQLGTEDQGWVAHFLLRALAGEPITIYGDGRQVRDILFVDDAVAAYIAAWRRIGAVSGRAFNLGGGPANAVSLLQLLALHRADARHGRGRAIRGLAAGRSALLRLRHAAAPRDARPAPGAALARTASRRSRPGSRRSGRARRGASPRRPTDAGRARQSALALRAQHLFRLPRAASAAGTRLRAGACCERAGHETLLLDAHLCGLDETRCRRAVAAFRPDMTVVTTAPSYLFWRCAPPELRVPRVDAGGDRAARRRDRRGRSARLGDAANRRCASSASMWSCGASARRSIAALADRGAPDGDRRDGVPARRRSAVCIGPTAAARFVGPARRCAGRTTGSRGTAHHHHRFDARAGRPGRRGGGVARLPLCLHLLRQDRLPRRLPPARPRAAARRDRRADRAGRALSLLHRRDLPAAAAAAGSARGARHRSSACRRASICGSRTCSTCSAAPAASRSRPGSRA